MTVAGVRRMHGLRAAGGEIDDGEPALTQRHPACRLDPDRTGVRSTVADGLDHRFADRPQCLVRGRCAPIDQSRNTAHWRNPGPAGRDILYRVTCSAWLAERRGKPGTSVALAPEARCTLGDPMKVLFLVRDLAVGGSQRQLAVLAAGLARRGHDVAVALLYAGGALETLLADSGVRLLPIEKSSRWDALAPLARLRRLFASEAPDLVYAFLPTQDDACRPAAAAKVQKPSSCSGCVPAACSSTSMTRSAPSPIGPRSGSPAAPTSSSPMPRAVRADAVTRGLRRDRIAVVPNGIDT